MEMLGEVVWNTVEIYFCAVRQFLQEGFVWEGGCMGMEAGIIGDSTSCTSSSTRLRILSSPSMGGRSLSIFSFAARRTFEIRYWRSSGDWSSILR